MDEKVTILIDNQEFSGWTDVELTLSMDTFDTVQFSAPFDASRKELRAVFQPFSYKPVQVGINGQNLFTGTIVGVEPSCDPDSASVQVSAYAKPGVLCDCTVPGNFAVQVPGQKEVAIGTYPRTFLKSTLESITAQLCAPFGIAASFSEPTGAPFEKVAIKFDETIHSFLVELAKQRGFLLTSVADGGLFFWKSITDGDVVVKFAEGTPPLTSVNVAFSPQEYYSHITGFVPVKQRKHGSTYTVPNKLAKGFFRPHACAFDDIERADVETAVNAKMGRMFANAVAYTVNGLPTWRDPKNRLWTPNTLVRLFAPSAMVYKQTELLIRNVHLKQTKDELSASLDLVLPEVFSGETPDTLPWLE